MAPVAYLSSEIRSNWKEEPLSFALITGWILSLALTTVVFTNSYLPTGLSLIDGIYGKKLLIVVPVLMVMGFVFYTMTLLIIGGLLNIMILLFVFILSCILNLILILLGGNSNIWDTFKALLYGAFPFLLALVNIFLMILVKYKLLSLGFWIASEKVIFFIMAIYLFYIFAAAGRTVHKVNSFKSYLAAALPFLIILAVNFIISEKILPKVAGFLS